MKRIAFGIVAAMALAACQARPTLEEAQAACTQKGGLLAVIYTQKITGSGVGAAVGTPGQCIQASRFEAKPASPPVKEQP